MNVRRINQTIEGSPAPTGDAPDQLRAATARWAHIQDQVRGQPWSQCPDDMVADFVRAAAADLQASYGPSAQQKALEAVGITLASMGADALTLSVADATTGQGLEMDFSLALAAPVDAPHVAFELDLPAGATEEDARQALGEWAHGPLGTPAFDPLTGVSGADLKALLRQIEVLDPSDDMDVLMTAAGALVVWQHLQAINAGTSQARLCDLEVAGAPLCAGHDVVLEFRQTQSPAASSRPRLG